MGWLISIPLFVVGLVTKSDALIMTSGLFAIAGGCGEIATRIKKDK